MSERETDGLGAAPKYQHNGYTQVRMKLKAKTRQKQSPLYLPLELLTELVSF